MHPYVVHVMFDTCIFGLQNIVTMMSFSSTTKELVRPDITENAVSIECGIGSAGDVMFNMTGQVIKYGECSFRERL